MSPETDQRLRALEIRVRELTERLDDLHRVLNRPKRFAWRVRAFRFALTRGYDVRTAWYITGVFMEPTARISGETHLKKLS